MAAWFEADTRALNIGMDFDDVATLAFALLGVSPVETLAQAGVQIEAGAFLVFGRRTAVATFLRVRGADSNEDDV